MATFAFSGAVPAISAYGQKTKLRFVGTWAVGDTWTLAFTSTLTGDFTLGKGNIAGQTFGGALKLRDRMYIGLGASFALSSNNDVTKWEEQDTGAAVISFVSQFGPQDTVSSFASLQSRLVVIGKLSSQLWSVDADPNAMSLQQTFDNAGTPSPNSVQSIGDFDVIYLDYSGFRSFRAKESTLNAATEDIGTAIDLLVRSALVSYDASQVVSIVEPTTKQYWAWLNGNIYVLSNYPFSKIVAWSTYKATYSSAGVQTAFTPTKFVVFNGQIYVRASSGKIYQYGGSDNNTFDNCIATVELPWLDLGEPTKEKTIQQVAAAFKGEWTLQFSTNPRASSYVTAVSRGSTTTPSMVEDSTFDLGIFAFNGTGTHLKIKAFTDANATLAKLGKIAIEYDLV